MKISVDAGALCSTKRFGTYIFTENILKALSQYDTANTYTGYLYKRKADLPSSENLKFKILRPSLGWMAMRVSMEELMNPKDVYLGLSQAIPWASKARIISFLHGISFFLHKDLYPDSYEALKDQVMFATSRSQKIIVSSAKVKEELGEHFGYTDAVVIPFGVPFDMEGGGKRAKSEKPYFLFVGMSHQIKNIDFLIKAFTIFKEQSRYDEFELILVGDHHKFIDEKLKIKSVQVDRSDLVGLYRNATGYLTASLYESFNLPVLEAISQGCNVTGKSSAIVPELRPFVTVADEVEEFVVAMKELVAKKKKLDVKDMKEKFSWEKYVTKLTSLY